MSHLTRDNIRNNIVKIILAIFWNKENKNLFYY